MHYGELTHHTDEYVCGHRSGVNRGADDLYNYIKYKAPLELFAGLNKKQREENRSKLLNLLESETRRFINECETDGLGIPTNEKGEKLTLTEFLEMHWECKEIRLEYRWKDVNGRMFEEPDETFSFWGNPKEMKEYYEEQLPDVLNWYIGDDITIELECGDLLIVLEHIETDYQKLVENGETEE